jgi:uncharacterized membrane protein YoaK (UPF0700 family)
MIQNVLFWIPILLLILFIIVKKKYKQHFENLGENADILEKALMILILTYYFYKGIFQSSFYDIFQESLIPLFIGKLLYFLVYVYSHQHQVLNSYL